MTVETTPAQRLDEATKSAVAEWESLGAPLSKGYGESTRQSMRGWPDNGAFTKEVFRLATHFTEQERMRLSNEAAIQAIQARQAAQQKAKAQMVAEMKALREEIGLTQTDMAALIGVNLAKIRNLENGGTFSNATFERALDQYRAIAKLRAPVAGRSKPA